MAFHSQALQAVFHREASESNGAATPGAVACHRFDVAWEVPQDGGPGLLAPIPDLSCVDLCSAWGLPAGQDALDPSAIQAQSDDNQWLLLPTVGATANGLPALQDEVIIVGVGVTTIRLKTPALRLSGAALAAFVTPPSDVDGYVLYTSQGGERRKSNAIFLSFVDTSKDTLPSIENLLRVTELQFINGTARTPLGTTSSGTVFYVNDCGAAYNDPCECVYIDPADIGNANEQIPTSVRSNSPSHYRFHPSVFFRRAQAVRAFLALDPTNTTQVAEDEGNLQIFQVDRAPTHSRWALIVDGAEMDVVLAHPAGSDLRRPRDIWNLVLVSAMLQNNAGGSALTTFRVDDSTGPRLFIADDLIKRMEYLQYARFIEVLDGDTQPIMTPVTQTVPNGGPS